MSEGMAVSIVWLLAIMCGLSIMANIFMLYLVGSVEVGIRALNSQILQWRKEFAATFDHVEVDGMSDDLWGSDDEQELRKG